MTCNPDRNPTAAGDCEYGLTWSRALSLLRGEDVTRFRLHMQHRTRTICPEHGMVVHDLDFNALPGG